MQIYSEHRCALAIINTHSPLVDAIIIETSFSWMCRVMSKKRRSADMPVLVCDSTYAHAHNTHTRAHTCARTHAHILKTRPGRAAACAPTGDPRLLSEEDQGSSVSVQFVESE